MTAECPSPPPPSPKTTPPTPAFPPPLPHISTRCCSVPPADDSRAAVPPPLPSSPPLKPCLPTSPLSTFSPHLPCPSFPLTPAAQFHQLMTAERLPHPASPLPAHLLPAHLLPAHLPCRYPPPHLPFFHWSSPLLQPLPPHPVSPPPPPLLAFCCSVPSADDGRVAFSRPAPLPPSLLSSPCHGPHSLHLLMLSSIS